MKTIEVADSNSVPTLSILFHPRLSTFPNLFLCFGFGRSFSLFLLLNG